MARYALHISIPLEGTKTVTYKYKPSFQDMYKHLDCDMIEMSTAHIPEWSNRKDGYTDIYFDEEGKFKEMVIPNKHITNAWYSWMENTGRMPIRNDFIAGKVAVIQELKETE